MATSKVSFSASPWTVSELGPCLRLLRVVLFPFLLLRAAVTSFKFRTDLPRSPLVVAILMSPFTERCPCSRSISVLATIQPRVMSGRGSKKQKLMHSITWARCRALRVWQSGFVSHYVSWLELFTSSILIHSFIHSLFRKKVFKKIVTHVMSIEKLKRENYERELAHESCWLNKFKSSNPEVLNLLESD